MRRDRAGVSGAEALSRTSSAELSRQRSAEERARRLAAQRIASIAESQAAEASQELAATEREIAETVRDCTGRQLPAATCPPFANGTAVLVSGLKRNTDVNGRRGNVVSFDADAGRYVVSLDGRTVKLKPSNLAVADDVVELGQIGGTRHLGQLPMSAEQMSQCKALAQAMGTTESDARALLERHGWDSETAVCAAVDEDPTVIGRVGKLLGFSMPQASDNPPETMDGEIDALCEDMCGSGLSDERRQLLKNHLVKFAASRGISVGGAIYMMKQAMEIDPSQSFNS